MRLIVLLVIQILLFIRGFETFPPVFKNILFIQAPHKVYSSVTHADKGNSRPPL